MDLDATSWIEHVPGWLHAAGELSDELMATARWEQRSRCVTYRSVWINLYRTQRDSTSWHGDPISKVQETSTVPVLSLGAARRFLVRPAAGDLVVMGGRCQRDWRHSVPKQATQAGPRISVNFAPFRT